MGVARQRGPARSLKDLKREISARNGEPPPPPRSSHKHKPAEVNVVKMKSDLSAPRRQWLVTSKQVVDEQGVPYTTSQVLSAEPWTPSPYTAFKVSTR